MFELVEAASFGPRQPLAAQTLRRHLHAMLPGVPRLKGLAVAATDSGAAVIVIGLQGQLPPAALKAVVGAGATGS